MNNAGFSWHEDILWLLVACLRGLLNHHKHRRARALPVQAASRITVYTLFEVHGR